MPGRQGHGGRIALIATTAGRSRRCRPPPAHNQRRKPGEEEWRVAPAAAVDAQSFCVLLMLFSLLPCFLPGGPHNYLPAPPPPNGAAAQEPNTPLSNGEFAPPRPAAAASPPPDLLDGVAKRLARRPPSKIELGMPNAV